MIPHEFRSTTNPHSKESQAVDVGVSSEGGPVESYEFPYPSLPSFNRTFSAPLPIRIRTLRTLRHPLNPSVDPPGNAHPKSVSAFSPRTARPRTFAETVTPLQTLSMELADTLQSAIQTLLHLSPPHLLDNAKEQYSGCTVQIPATSLSALFTSMRSLNYLSANVGSLVEPVVEDEGLLSCRRSEDLDIGELLQNVADLLSGQAAQADVDFVIFHGDVGIKHLSVQGDSEGLAYVLSHVSYPLVPADAR